MPNRQIKKSSNTWRSLIRPIFVGLGLSQVVATIAVHISNKNIWSTAKALASEGYLPIPTGPAMQTLTQFGTAFGGGLFFTLSIGTGLTLLTWTAIYLWDRRFQRNRNLLLAYLSTWLLLLVWTNSAGPAWLPAVFGLLVPPVTAWATARGLAADDPAPMSRFWGVPAIALALLTALWATQLNRDIFVSIRDHILLSNPVGQRVNDFYYRYTLYAAETFKSFQQKTIRTYRWDGEIDPNLKLQIDKGMLRYDVLALAGQVSPDLVLAHRQGKLVMTGRSGRRLEPAPAEFIAETSKWLQRFSQRTDRLANFRRMTLYGLLMGFPTLLFVLIYSGWRTLTGLLMDEDRAILSAAALCALLGIMLFLPMLEAGSGQITRQNLATALASESWPMRVAALRFIEHENIDISRYPQYRHLVESPLVVERYWLARAMAVSRTQSTYAQLTALIKDPHPNVVCQAYFALGNRRTPKAVQTIYRQLITSDHWYTQWYGYRAMRGLGWQQKPSN